LIGIYFELGWIYCLLDGVMNKISVEMNDAEVKYFFLGMNWEWIQLLGNKGDWGSGDGETVEEDASWCEAFSLLR